MAADPARLKELFLAAAAAPSPAERAALLDRACGDDAELRRLAAQKLARERPGQTLEATALVHEAYLRLAGDDSSRPWDSRGHFFAAAAEAMRRILVDRARARRAEKRGGDRQRVPAELDQIAARYSDAELIDTDSTLDALAREDAAAADLVRLHVFSGFSVEEAGAALGMSRATAYRNWSFARAWLRASLGPPP